MHAANALIWQEEHLQQRNSRTDVKIFHLLSSPLTLREEPPSDLGSYQRRNLLVAWMGIVKRNAAFSFQWCFLRIERKRAEQRGKAIQWI